MLPKSWKPNNSRGLIRVGPNKDAGYVIPKIVLEKTKILIGLGLGEDWSFETDFKKRSGCEVVCYDHSITSSFWRKKFRKDLSAFLLLKRLKPRKFSAMFNYFSYKLFFNGKNATHHKIMVGYDLPGSISIDGIIKNCSQKDGIFFKIDIEGSEYRVIDQLNNYKDSLIGFVIEFHDVDIHRDRITKYISSLNGYKLVHIHANNDDTRVDMNGDPLTVEMTFLNDNLVGSNEKEDNSYPIEGLDFPNNPRLKDFKLVFESA
ncbi:hypothetical protein [Kaarinaea lacus]